jgi:hypothetical protein
MVLYPAPKLLSTIIFLISATIKQNCSTHYIKSQETPPPSTLKINVKKVKNWLQNAKYQISR